MQWLIKLLTGKDNSTPDLGRWSWAISTAAVLAHDGYQLYKGVHVDIQTLAVALAAVAAAHGIAIGAKGHTEPGGVS